MDDTQKLQLIEFLFDKNVQTISDFTFTSYYSEDANSDHVLVLRYWDNGGNGHKIGIFPNGITRTYEL